MGRKRKKSIYSNMIPKQQVTHERKEENDGITESHYFWSRLKRKGSRNKSTMEKAIAVKRSCFLFWRHVILFESLHLGQGLVDRPIIFPTKVCPVGLSVSM